MMACLCGKSEIMSAVREMLSMGERFPCTANLSTLEDLGTKCVLESISMVMEWERLRTCPFSLSLCEVSFERSGRVALTLCERKCVKVFGHAA